MHLIRVGSLRQRNEPSDGPDSDPSPRAGSLIELIGFHPILLAMGSAVLLVIVSVLLNPDVGGPEATPPGVGE